MIGDPLNLPPQAARLEARKKIFSRRVVEDCNRVPPEVKRANGYAERKAKLVGSTWYADGEIKKESADHTCYWHSLRGSTWAILRVNLQRNTQLQSWQTFKHFQHQLTGTSIPRRWRLRACWRRRGGGGWRERGRDICPSCSPLSPPSPAPSWWCPPASLSQFFFHEQVLKLQNKGFKADSVWV